MSKGLVRKAVHLVDSDDDEDRAKQLNDRFSQDSRRTRRTSVKKDTKQAGESSVPGESVKRKSRLKLSCYGLTPDHSRLENYRRQKAEDRTKDNIRMIKKVRSIKIDNSLATKLLQKMGKVDVPSQEQKPDQTNFVTDEDFKRYMRQCLR